MRGAREIYMANLSSKFYCLKLIKLWNIHRTIYVAITRVYHHADGETRGMVGLMMVLMEVMCYCSDFRVSWGRGCTSEGKRVHWLCSCASPVLFSQLPTDRRQREWGKVMGLIGKKELRRVKRNGGMNVKIHMCMMLCCANGVFFLF